MANPVVQTIDLSGATGQCSGYITCVTNAGFTQQAVITVVDANNRTVASGTFQGNGEGNTQIPLIGGGTLLSYSNAKLPLTFNGQFNYDPNGNFAPVDPNNVLVTVQLDLPSIECFIVKTEDWVDGDYNDLILTCVTVNH